MEFNPTRAIVNNEDCDLHYWYQGSGPLITFVPGGNGHGRQFNNMIAALSDRFTCVTFDRRQMSASKAKVNTILNPAQQARDIRTIIKAMGFEKSILFGSSGGGLFSLQFAHDFPEMVDHLISHEAPVTGLLPDASEVLDWFANLWEVYKASGWEQAQSVFETKMIGYDDEGIPKTVPPPPENPKNFWDNEFLVLMGYIPNFWRLKENKTSIGLMKAVRCKDGFYVRCQDDLAKILDCPLFTVPGHHQGFECETEEFLPRFLEMLDTLDKKRRGI